MISGDPADDLPDDREGPGRRASRNVPSTEISRVRIFRPYRVIDPIASITRQDPSVDWKGAK